jgi:hypothetical protein
MGINHSTPTEVCSGPLYFASMEVLALWTMQGFSKDKLMFGHLWKSDIVGDNLQVKLDCLQLQTGTSWNVLSHNGALFHSYVDHCWATNLWEFNDCYDLTIHHEDCPWLLPQCNDDQFIMEALTNLPKVTKAWLKGAQCCH